MKIQIPFWIQNCQICWYDTIISSMWHKTIIKYQVGFGSFMKISLISLFWGKCLFCYCCLYFLHILKFKKYSIPLLITVHLLHYLQSLVSPWTLKLSRTLHNRANSVSWSFERNTFYLILIFWISASSKCILNNACLLF